MAGSNGDDNGWHTVSEAARRLGVTRQAIQARIRRGTLETRVETAGNRQRRLVRLPQAVPQPAAQAAPQAVAQAERDELITELRARITSLELSHTEAREREQRLLAIIEQLTAERRSIWQELRAWVARRIQG